MPTRFLDWLAARTRREAALLCLLVTTGCYAGLFHACLDFRGVWSTERYDIPGWEAMRDRHMGKRTLMRNNALYIESMGLTIVPDWRH